MTDAAVLGEAETTDRPDLTQQIRDAGMQEKAVEFRKSGDLYVRTSS